MTAPPLLVAVAGLRWSGADYVAAKLRQSSLISLENPSLVPLELDDFFRRRGLLIWVDTHDDLRLRRAVRAGAYPRNRASLDRFRAERQAVFADWPHQHLSTQPHHGYAWKMAHVLIYNNQGRPLLCRRLQWLIAQLTSVEVAFVPRPYSSTLPPPVGARQLQQLVIGYQFPPIPPAPRLAWSPRPRRMSHPHRDPL